MTMGRPAIASDQRSGSEEYGLARSPGLARATPIEPKQPA